ncbi:S41 family peptidase [Kordiimonas laminariae]|uniref:S41 family peptidase n=1 Tax=Kordiimonas laminariae TaxID=2917717 RepID=UPI001FF4E8B1|nr:S41 family peptidase [Kordiimonas laminariae]MCK0070299.1 S41 family peptidase [Kordiimonas laminariae]
MKYLVFLALGLLVYMQAKATGNLDGVWKTEGYGFLFHIEGSQVSIFGTSGVSCLPSVLSPGSVTYQSGDEYVASFPVAVSGFIEADMRVTAPDNGIRYFSRSDTGSKMKAECLSELPTLCVQPVDRSVEATTIAFLSIFEQNYPFFEEKKISWDKEAILKGASAVQSSAELHDLFVNELLKFRDPHTVLVAPDVERYFFGAEHVERVPAYNGFEQVSSVIEDHYLTGGVSSYCNNQFQFADIKSGILYLRLASFTPCEEYEAALDELFKKLQASDKLIIDLRSNVGGSDQVALQLLSRLTKDDYVAYLKQAAVDFAATGEWTAPESIVVKAFGENSYDGDIVVLTDAGTMSAAETFLMGLKGRTPKVTQVGEATVGAFSDILPRILPNGFLLGLPNERYVDGSGKSFDMTGLKPDIAVALNLEKLLAGQDNQLDTVLEILN